MRNVAAMGLRDSMLYLLSVSLAHDCPFGARPKDAERIVQFDNHGGFDDVGLRS
jgi:hypothetical protein